jgi:hypothetical protein
VGLVAREVEAAGIATIVLSNIPDLTAASGAPRIAGIEYPIGLTMGLPDDVVGQTAVLRETLLAFDRIAEPGGMVHLPFEWPGTPEGLATEPPVPPPIVPSLTLRPWLIPKLFRRDVPG